MRTMIGIMAAAMLLGAGPGQAQQGWDFVAPLTTATLADGQELIDGPYWFPNAETAQTATHAIGVVYYPIAGAAGNFNIGAGVFIRDEAEWKLLAPVPELYGTEPRNPEWQGDPVPTSVTMTTTTLKESDPRCCPTGETRFTIDLTSGAVTGPD